MKPLRLLEPLSSLSLIRFVTSGPVRHVGLAGWPLRDPPFREAVGDCSSWRGARSRLRAASGVAVSRPVATFVYFQPPLGPDPKTQPCRHCGELWSKHEVVDDRDGELRQCRAVALAGKVGRERYHLVPAVAVLGLVPHSTPFAVLDDLEKVGLALCWDLEAAQRIVDALNAAANGGAP